MFALDASALSAIALKFETSLGELFVLSISFASASESVF